MPLYSILPILPPVSFQNTAYYRTGVFNSTPLSGSVSGATSASLFLTAGLELLEESSNYMNSIIILIQQGLTVNKFSVVINIGGQWL